MKKPATFGVEPYVFVLDMAAATDFYVAKLGFEITISDGDPPFFVQVMRSGARLNLRLVDAAVIDPIRRETEELLSAAVTVDDINGLYAEFSSAGANFQRHLHTAPWGARTFIIRDPDGNLIMFAG